MTALGNENSENIYENGVFCTVPELFYESRKARNADLHAARTRAVSAGGKRSKIRGRGMEYFESRPYVPQDEMRTIDWKVSARFSKLFTKVFIEERDRPIYVIVDSRPSMFFGSRRRLKSVLAAHIAARIATAAINGGDHVSGIIFDQHQEIRTPLGGTRKSLAHVFSAIAAASKRLLDEAGTGSLSWLDVLRGLRSRARPGAQIYLISDFLDVSDETRHILFRLTKNAHVFACAVFDPLEERIPALGRVGMTFGQERVIFNSNDTALQQRYEMWWQEQQARVAAIFRGVGIPLMTFSTKEEPDIGLRRVFLGQW